MARRSRSTPAAWLAELRARPMPDVVAALGLEIRAGGLSPCPACGAERRSRTDSRPPVALLSAGWKCHVAKCGAGGSRVDLAAWVMVGRKLEPGDRAGWADLHAGLERIDLVTPGTARRAAAPLHHRPAPAPPVPDRPPPDPGEVLDLWHAAGPLEDDPAVVAWLLSRRGWTREDVAALSRADVARVLAPGTRCPSWARAAGRSWAEGWPVLLPTYAPPSLPFRDLPSVGVAVAPVPVGLLARRPGPGDGPKEVSPAGRRRVGVLASPVARLVLAAGGRSGAVPVAAVVVAEGTTDTLAATLAAWELSKRGSGWRPERPGMIWPALLAAMPAAGPELRQAARGWTRRGAYLAVVGGLSGSWTAVARAVVAMRRAAPPGEACPVLIATHADLAGDGYRAKILAALVAEGVPRDRVERVPLPPDCDLCAPWAEADDDDSRRELAAALDPWRSRARIP